MQELLDVGQDAINFIIGWKAMIIAGLIILVSVIVIKVLAESFMKFLLMMIRKTFRGIYKSVWWFLCLCWEHNLATVVVIIVCFMNFWITCETTAYRWKKHQEEQTSGCEWKICSDHYGDKWVTNDRIIIRKKLDPHFGCKGILRTYEDGKWAIEFKTKDGDIEEGNFYMQELQNCDCFCSRGSPTISMSMK